MRYHTLWFNKKTAVCWKYFNTALPPFLAFFSTTLFYKSLPKGLSTGRVVPNFPLPRRTADEETRLENTIKVLEEETRLENTIKVEEEETRLENTIKVEEEETRLENTIKVEEEETRLENTIKVEEKTSFSLLLTFMLPSTRITHNLKFFTREIKKWLSKEIHLPDLPSLCSLELSKYYFFPGFHMDFNIHQ